MRKYRYLFLRRVIQVSIMILFVSGNIMGWPVLRGNLSSARLLNFVPMSDPFAVLQTLSAGTVPAVDAITGALIVLLAYAIAGGRVFCGWVCPVNIVTDFANRLRGLLRLEKDPDQSPLSRRVRYWVLGLSLALSAILGTAAFEWISPIGALHRLIIFGSFGGMTLVIVVFLFDLFGTKNGFCGHVCPLGGFYALTGRFGFLRIGHERDRCTMCLKCKSICPEPQVLDIVGRQSGAVLSGECINCGRCIEVCEDEALAFRNIYGINNR
jgi:ferredoxin-type protein NapH